MLNLINITQARNNLSRVVEEVASEKKTYILIRDSVPQAVVIPYDEYQLQEDKWQEQVDILMGKGSKVFKKWLKEKKMKYPLSENGVCKIIDKVAGRS